MTAIFLHLFYTHLYDEIKTRLKAIQIPFNLYVNLVAEYSDNLTDTILSDSPGAVINVSTNKGMDPGGQLRTLDYWLKHGKNEEFLVFLHSKGKPQHLPDKAKVKETDELRALLMSIIEPDKIVQIQDLFQDPQVGMVGVKDWHRYPGLDHGDPIKECEHYCELLGLNNYETNRFGFIGGTMFWVRSSIFRKAFENVDIPKLVSELPFRDSGGLIHGLERIFGYIVLSQDYKIVGI